MVVSAMTAQGPGGGGDDRFESIHERYRARIVAYFRRVFGVSPAEAEDLTQDSFIRFYKAMDRYAGETEWAPLWKIARNVGLNRLRSTGTIKRGSIRTASLDDAESTHEAMDDTQKHPIDTMIEAERLRRLQVAIDELPKGQRRCLQLWLEDLSGEEIAEALRITVVAVKSRIRDAKRALRERLGDEDALPED
jgi:RNA polymerase sigma-70 factor (ECF subfamily)